MENFLILLLCFLGGIGYQKYQSSDQSQKVLHFFIIHISLPALILSSLPKLKWNSHLILFILCIWFVYLLGWVYFSWISRFLQIEDSTRRCLILTGSLGNTSFLGIPMIIAFYGADFVPIGILCDQTGSFLILSLLGIPLAIQEKNDKFLTKSSLERLIRFPPFISFLLAIPISFIGLHESLQLSFEKLSGTLAPLALFSVGFQFSLSHLKKHLRYLTIGLSYKMILAPLVITGILFLSGQWENPWTKIVIFESAMPPMITASIISIQNRLNPELAASMVGLGVLLSFPILSFWYWVL